MRFLDDLVSLGSRQGTVAYAGGGRREGATDICLYLCVVMVLISASRLLFAAGWLGEVVVYFGLVFGVGHLGDKLRRM